jgi:hypothetical protein
MWYKVHITEEAERGRGSGGAAPKSITGTQFTGFTCTKGQILTEVGGLRRRASQVLSLLALLVQKYKY